MLLLGFMFYYIRKYNVSNSITTLSLLILLRISDCTISKLIYLETLKKRVSVMGVIFQPFFKLKINEIAIRVI